MPKTIKKTVTKKTSSMKEGLKSKKTVGMIKKLRSFPETPESVIKEVKKPPFGFLAKLVLVLAIGSALFLLVQKYRSLFLAGTVNSQPITRFELNNKMAEKYGKQTFDEIVSERLLASELKKKNITVSDQEVSDEIAKIVKEYGSEDAFKSALAQYGLSEDKAKESIRQSLSLKKLIETTYKIEVADESVKKYYEENKKLFEGKKLEEVASSIKENLYQQEVYTKTQEWFTGVKKSAKVVSFI